MPGSRQPAQGFVEARVTRHLLPQDLPKQVTLLLGDQGPEPGQGLFDLGIQVLLDGDLTALQLLERLAPLRASPPRSAPPR